MHATKIQKGRFNGDMLYTRRVEMGFNLDQVAEKVHRSVSTLWAWENGQSQPRASILLALGKALNVEPVYFFAKNNK